MSIFPLKKRKKVKKWIQGTDMNKGGLHRALGIPEDQKIPADKLAAALKSKNPHIRRMARFANTLKSLG